MRDGIVRAADWFFDRGRTLVWFYRGARWFSVAMAFRLVVNRDPPIWADLAVMAVCLYGELRDWRARKYGYSLYLRLRLMSSVMASTLVAASVPLLYVTDPTKLQHGSRSLIIAFLFGINLTYLLMNEVRFQRGLAEQAITAPTSALPPLLAEYVLYIALPRREREPLVGDLSEDFETNVLPKFGPLYARGWYWYKALLYVWMYTCANAIEPLIRHVIDPLWRRVVLPLLKWIVVPVLLVPKRGWVDAVRAYLDKFR